MLVITGATGNIGSKVTGILLARGQKVKVVGRNAEKLKGFVDKGAEAAGLSEDVSRLFIEMSKALNEGLFAVNLPRTKENSSGTSIEEFADTFVNIYFSEK